MIGPGGAKNWEEMVIRQERRKQWGSPTPEAGQDVLLKAIAVSLGAVVVMQETIGKGIC